MRIFKVLASDIANNPDQWEYEEYYLKRYVGVRDLAISVKITFFCNAPHVILIGKISIKPGILGRIRLWYAGRKWLSYRFKGLEDSLIQSLPIDKWMEKREAEVAARNKS
jgi:hypothetical protein